MEQCPETSAYKIQKPGNCPEESTQHSEHGDSFKSRLLKVTNKMYVEGNGSVTAGNAQRLSAVVINNKGYFTYVSSCILP